jgi:hypothetical protein
MEQEELNPGFLQLMPSSGSTLTIRIKLTKDMIEEALESNYLLINGKYYDVPKSKLKENLINGYFGEMMLELTESK